MKVEKLKKKKKKTVLNTGVQELYFVLQMAREFQLTSRKRGSENGIVAMKRGTSHL